MVCDFDGGDCCEASCVSSDDGNDGDDDTSCSYVDDCKGPYKDWNKQWKGQSVWPCKNSVDNPTYPFNTQEALLSVMQGKASSESTSKSYTYKDLPSLSCPDCFAFNGSYMAIPFHVTASKPEAPMFPAMNESRKRYFH